MHTHQQTTAATNDNIVNSPINRVCADVKEEATRSRPWREASDARAATRWTTARRRRWTWAAARAYPAVVTSHRGAATKGRYSSCRPSKVIICLFIYVCLYIWACVCVCFARVYARMYVFSQPVCISTANSDGCLLLRRFSFSFPTIFYTSSFFPGVIDGGSWWRRQCSRWWHIFVVIS